MAQSKQASSRKPTHVVVRGAVGDKLLGEEIGAYNMPEATSWDWLEEQGVIVKYGSDEHKRWLEDNGRAADEPMIEQVLRTQDTPTLPEPGYATVAQTVALTDGQTPIAEVIPGVSDGAANA